MTKELGGGTPRTGAGGVDRGPQHVEACGRPPFERLSALMPAIIAAAKDDAARRPAARPPAVPGPSGRYVVVGVLAFGAVLLGWFALIGSARAGEGDEARASEHAIEEAAPRRAARARHGAGKAAAIEAAKAAAVEAEAQRRELEERRYSVACLLDRAKCPPPEPVAAVVPALASEESLLPERLELADINDGTRQARAAAVGRCRELARGGEVVRIKLSIAGPSGSVLSARPEDDAGNPQLAACCAEELAGASFKRVRKPQIGAVTTIKF